MERWTSATRRWTRKATSALLVDAFGDIGLDTLAGRHPAWITIARNFLVEIGPPPVRPDRAVLQIKAYAAREDLLQILQGLSRQGYSIALDEYDGSVSANIDELMALCSIVKVDVSAVDPGGAAGRAARAEDAGRAAGGLPTSPTTRRSSAAASSASPTSRASTSPSRGSSSSRSVATAGLGSLRRLSELTAGEVSFEDLERIISSDVGLSLKLLRYVNSAFFALPRTISSVREALNLLGVRTVRRGRR